VFAIFVQRAARFRCCAEPSSQEQETSTAPPTPPPEKPEGAFPPSLLGISTSTWSAGVAGLGFLETGYLTYLKLTGSEAFCPISGGGCGDILESDYSVVFGNLLELFFLFLGNLFAHLLALLLRAFVGKCKLNFGILIMKSRPTLCKKSHCCFASCCLYKANCTLIRNNC
jgi:uncharacterized membrane protein